MNNLKRYQNIDFANGGDVRGMIRATETYLRVANDDTKVVVGHGPLANKKDIAEFHEMLIISADRIERLVKDGKSEQPRCSRSMPLADLNQKWAPGNPSLAQQHVRNVYRSFQRL